MEQKAKVIEVTLESTLESIEVAEQISRRVSLGAGFEEEAEFQIEMAVHEAVANAVCHGNKENRGKKVYLKFLTYHDRLEIHVRDQGCGFDPGKIADPVASENLLKVSGRGIFLVRQFMDSFKVEDTGGAGTEVVMTKRIVPKLPAHTRRSGL